MNVPRPLPELLPAGLGWFPFAHRYLGNRVFFLFLQVLRCFSSPGWPLTPMYSAQDTAFAVGFPIRTSPDQRLYATPRSFSQRNTSFIASLCQGIRHEPFTT